MYLRSRRRLGDGFNHEIHEKNVEMYACAARRRLGTTWANGLGREALLRAPDLSPGGDGRGVNPHPPARDHSQPLR